MKVKIIVLFLILLAAVYQDFPMVNYFGEIAKSPIVFLTPFFLFYVFKERKMPLTNYVKTYVVYLLYIAFISLIYTIYLIVKNKSFYVFDENLLIKNIKMFFYPLCSLIFYQFIYVFLKRTSNLYYAFQAVFYLQILLVLLLIFEVNVYKTKEIFLPFLHSSSEKYWRIRLLTFESSWSGSVVVIFTFLPIFLAEYLQVSKNKRLAVYILSVFFFFYYTLHCESKGYLFLVLISLLPMLIRYVYANKRLRYVLFILLIPIVITFVFVYNSLKEEVISQLYSSITFGTRFTGYSAALKTFLFNPFGVGFAPYIEIYTHSILDVVSSDFMQQFNLLEVKQYLESPKFLSSKTYFFDHLIYGGIPFLVFFYLFFIRRLNYLSRFKNIYLLIIVLVYIILASIFYLTFHIKYEIWFFLAFLDYFEKHELKT